MSLTYFDISIGGVSKGRIIFRLYDEVVPKTAANFRSLCQGDKGLGITTKKKLHYGKFFHHLNHMYDFELQRGCPLSPNN